MVPQMVTFSPISVDKAFFKMYVSPANYREGHRIPGFSTGHFRKYGLESRRTSAFSLGPN